MPPSDPRRIVLICEDKAHRTLATFLVDRVLLAEARAHGVDWLDEDSLEWSRVFCGRAEDDGKPDHPGYYASQRISADTEDFSNQVQIGGRPVRLRGSGTPEEKRWRRCFILFAREEPAPGVILLVQDTDGDRAKIDGMKSARDFMRNALEGEAVPVVLATPHQDAEAWFAAGFEPRSEAEEKRLDALAKELSFRPNHEPHRLTARPNDARTDAKRVLNVLVWARDESLPPPPAELPDLADRTLGDLELLERRGAACMLPEFLQELRAILFPVISGRAHPAE